MRQRKLRPQILPCLIIIAMLFGTAACKKDAKHEAIDKTLKKREAALKNLDIEQIFPLYDKSYTTKHYSLEELKALAVSSGKKLEDLKIDFLSRELYTDPADKSVLVVIGYRVEGTVRGKKMVYRDDEGLVFKKAPSGEMLITEGDEVLDIISYRMVNEAEIKAVLGKRKAAIQARDPEAYMEIISDSYEDPKGNIESLKQAIQEMMKIDGPTMLQISDARIYLERDGALAEEPWSLFNKDTGNESVSQPKASGIQGIVLKKTGGQWQITGGLRE